MLMVTWHNTFPKTHWPAYLKLVRFIVCNPALIKLIEQESMTRPRLSLLVQRAPGPFRIPSCLEHPPALHFSAGWGHWGRGGNVNVSCIPSILPPSPASKLLLHIDCEPRNLTHIIPFPQARLKAPCRHSAATLENARAQAASRGTPTGRDKAAPAMGRWELGVGFGAWRQQQESTRRAGRQLKPCPASPGINRPCIPLAWAPEQWAQQSPGGRC